MARMTAAQQAEYNKIEALRDIDYAEYLDQMEDFLARMEYRNPIIHEGEKVIPTTLEEVVARLNFCEERRTTPHSQDYLFTIENNKVWVESLYDGEKWAKRSIESALADLTRRCAQYGKISEISTDKYAIINDTICRIEREGGEYNTDKIAFIAKHPSFF